MAVIIRGNVWRLRAQPGRMDDASTRWGRAAVAFNASWTLMGSSIERLDCTWSGSRAESYRTHADGLRSGMGEATDLAGRLRDALDDITLTLEQAQSELDSSFARARQGGSVTYQDDWEVHFTVPDDVDNPMPHLSREITRAEEIVDEARAALRATATTLSALAVDARALARSWRGPATGTPGWDVPSGGVTGVMTTTFGTTTVINTGDQRDEIEISVDGTTGETLVRIVSGGVTDEVRIPAGQTVVINAGDGDDEIVIGAGVTAHIRIVGGDGADTIDALQHQGNLSVFAGAGNDTVQTGAGRDYVSGGAGHDYIDTGAGDDVAFGGAGNDVIYGMDGDDVLFGGLGRDYLEGARGEDVLFGGGGNDILSGGRDDDVLIGGAGDDVMYAGLGWDRTHGGSGTDTAYVEGHETSRTSAESTEEVEIDGDLAAGAFDIQGDPEFVARVEADLDMMRSSPVGQHMLDTHQGHVDAGEDPIEVTTTATGSSANPTTHDVSYDHTRNTLDGFRVRPAPWHAQGFPPVLHFFHELGHVNQYRSGEDNGQFGAPGRRTTDADGDPLIERQNVGLPWDHDNDPSTPDVIDPDYDYELTENRFREELGLPPRRRYREQP